MFEKIIYTLGLLLMIALVFYLAYLTTRYIGSKAGKTGNLSSKKHLKIIETMCLGRDKYLFLIKAGNECILVASSNKGIEMLGKIDVDLDIGKVSEEEGMGRAGTAGSFKRIISSYINRNLSWYDDNNVNEEQSKNANEEI